MMADLIDGMNSDSTKKPENWKNQLSPAFNEEEIFYSLSVLGVFYVVYAVVKASFHVHYSGASDEELFIQSCYCSLNQRFFYRFWFSLCCVIWFYIHTYSFLSGLLTKRFPEFGDALKIFLAFCIVSAECCWSLVVKIILWCIKKCRVTCTVRYITDEEGNNKFDFSKIQYIKDKKLALKMKNNLALLWFQYCKMYVVGYAGHENDEIDKIVETNASNQNASSQNNRTNAQANQRNGCCTCSCECQEYNCICCSKKYKVCPTINVVCGREKFSNACSLKHIVRGILFGAKYISQLITVPLLLLQIFDSYSFLCFSPDPYCSHTTEYELHLVQTGITLSFYCSLVVAHLASTMLSWNPWPNDDDNSTGAMVSAAAAETSAAESSVAEASPVAPPPQQTTTKTTTTNSNDDNNKLIR